MKGYLYDIYVNVIEIIFPARCPGCDEILDATELSVGYCSNCRDKISYVGEVSCLVCGKPIASKHQSVCQDCSRVSHSFVQNKACYQYQDVIKGAMYRFKYSNRRAYARVFAKDIVRNYGDWIRDNHIDAITSVPIHPRKYRKRGYNQAQVLAKEIARLCQLPYVMLLDRVEDTKPQKELTNIERKKNLKNAFNIRAIGVKYSHILVVDDIYTTGATMDAISEVLHSGGVDKVFGITACIGKGH